MQDPFLGFASGENISSVTGLPLIISSPKASQLYNIFVSGFLNDIEGPILSDPHFYSTQAIQSHTG